MAETQLSRDEQYRSLPTLRVDNVANKKISGLVNAFKVTEQEGGLSSLELRLVNFYLTEQGSVPELAFEDERDLKLGSRITLYAGDEANPREIFRGLVSGIEAEFPRSGLPQLTVIAEDALQTSRMIRRTKVYSNLTLCQLATDMAGQLGLSPRINGLADGIGTHVQLNESDLAFLRRLLARYDADVQVVGSELHVSPRKDVQRNIVELELHSQLLYADFTVDLADQVTEITTSGWDPTQGIRVAGSSRGANLGPGAGRSGAQLLANSFAPRSEHVSNPTVLTSAEASALADAVFDRRARRFVRLRATAEGNPLIRVGTHVAVSGISGRFNNTYYVASACHCYEGGRGYETSFEAECAYLGYPS